MPRYIDTRGKAQVAIAVCARCGRKFPYSDLVADPNFGTGFWVCEEDSDDFDPYRLQPAPTENIALDHARPDFPLTVGPLAVPVMPMQAVISPNGQIGVATDVTRNVAIAVAPAVNPILRPSQAWAANTVYALGAEVTPGVAIGFTAANQTIPQFVCIVPGTSGPTAPTWNTAPGGETSDGGPAGGPSGVIWICTGVYTP